MGESGVPVIVPGFHPGGLVPGQGLAIWDGFHLPPHQQGAGVEGENLAEAAVRLRDADLTTGAGATPFRSARAAWVETQLHPWKTRQVKRVWSAAPSV